MKLTTSTIWQGVAYFAAIGPQVPGLLPLSPQWAKWITGLAAIAGLALHFNAGLRDPDGNLLPPPK